MSLLRLLVLLFASLDLVSLEFFFQQAWDSIIVVNLRLICRTPYRWRIRLLPDMGFIGKYRNQLLTTNDIKILLLGKLKASFIMMDRQEIVHPVVLV